MNNIKAGENPETLLFVKRNLRLLYNLGSVSKKQLEHLTGKQKELVSKLPVLGM